ncbi:MAG: DUF4912 domain-containing protein [Planctomycetaceae bacterium]
MTLAALKSRSRKSLESLARRQGVARWHSLTKAELVRALLRSSRATASASNGRKAKSESRAGLRRAGRSTLRRRGAATTESLSARNRDLCTTEVADFRHNGRANFIDVSICDSLWVRAHWDLTRDSIRRAESRLAADWHQATPVIRVLAVLNGDANNSSEVAVKDVPIAAGVDTWYLHVSPEHRVYRFHIGYLTRQRTFFGLAKSNLCHLPEMNAHLGTAGEGKAEGHARNGSDRNGHARDGAEARLGRPLGFSSLSHFGPAASQERKTGEFCFRLDTELIVHGTTRPGSTLTVQGEAVELRDDGSFTIRVNQPEGRQVVAFTAISPRGGERRMIVLGVERNTKELERQYFDGGHSEGYTD